MTAVTERKHRPVKAGNPKASHVICAECLVLWPCLAGHKAVTRCVVCGRFWSEHTDEAYRFGCRVTVS